MWKTTLSIEGMRCGMCESHLNDAIRRALPVKKVKSSHRKGEAILLSEAALSEADIRRAIDPTGYIVTAVRAAPAD